MYQLSGASIPRNPAANTLARVIERHLHTPTDSVTAWPALSFHRRNAPTEPVDCIYGPSLAVTTQGAKQVMLGDKVFNYGPGQALLTTIDLPMVAHVTRATMREPYLGLLLRLDVRKVALAASEIRLSPERASAGEAVSIVSLDPTLMEALLRLTGLLDDPPLAPHLAPLIEQEIIIRLLTGPHGPHLRKVVTMETPTDQITRVVTWIKQNFTKTMRMDELASHANMSPSAFRQYFRGITGMSPLQFQKQLRLQEARQLMLNQNMDAGHAANIVGYESASQFSREYNRLFGAPPQRDIRHMRSMLKNSP